MVSSIVILWLSCIAMLRSEDVIFYIADCIGELGLSSYHTYTGETLEAPPQNVSLSSTAMFKFEYSSRSEFGSFLDGNLNYYCPGASAANNLHYYWNVNSTGDVFAQIEYTGVIGSQICTDIKQGTGALPGVVGAYIWWKANTTYDQCKAMTDTIPQCTYTI